MFFHNWFGLVRVLVKLARVREARAHWLSLLEVPLDAQCAPSGERNAWRIDLVDDFFVRPDERASLVGRDVPPLLVGLHVVLLAW